MKSGIFIIINKKGQDKTSHPFRTVFIYYLLYFATSNERYSIKLAKSFACMLFVLVKQFLIDEHFKFVVELLSVSLQSIVCLYGFCHKHPVLS